MILSFRCKKTEALFKRTHVAAEWRVVSEVALRKLSYLHGAEKLEDLRIPPSNHLEKLKGDRHGQYSIRVNKKWRVCFYFIDNHAHEVEIVDYH